jgi:hypothetical protein
MSEPRQDSPGEQAKEGIDDGGFVENLNTTPTQATYFNEATARLSPAHREYLLQRHGTVDLDPIPDMGGADPYNWKTWMVGLSTPRTLKFDADSYFSRKSQIWF